MTVEQAVKKYKLEPLNVYTAKAKAKDMKDETGQKIRTQKEQAEEEARQMRENSLKAAKESSMPFFSGT